jgi:hypothetical protein
VGKSTLLPTIIERIDWVVWGEKLILPDFDAADPVLFIREPLIRSRKGAGVAPMKIGIILYIQNDNDYLF